MGIFRLLVGYFGLVAGVCLHRGASPALRTPIPGPIFGLFGGVLAGPIFGLFVGYFGFSVDLRAVAGSLTS